jgi:hypothetical protein
MLALIHEGIGLSAMVVCAAARDIRPLLSSPSTRVPYWQAYPTTTSPDGTFAVRVVRSAG